MIKKQRKKEFILSLRVSKEEYDFLLAEAEKDLTTNKRIGGKNLSAYLRKIVLQRIGYQTDEKLQRELKELVYQIRKIGVNINQATKQLNTAYRTMEAADRLEESMELVNIQLHEIRQELKKQYGNYKDDEH
ncbi:plasmid mobilization protein [Faecalimonas umbilicata]|uniref:plasmid mobilization protein n=1 Tax=Faecalimonas umbilicata TaxID=1912855 RepID=UPI0022E2C98D|nr:plasmid mobilization relaxosome protein MobC [Faecalimonas umbilicata]